MLISIVIPVYNREGIVRRTLACVAAQTHRPLQVVLVDNDSTDHSLAVLQQFKADHEAPGFEVVVAQETERHTAAAARQRGFELAKGDYVMFFDSDDLMTPDLAAAYAQVVEQRPDADIVLARSVLQHTDGTQQSLPFASSDFTANQILHSLMSSQRYIVRRTFFAASEGWNVDVRQWDDWELGLRLLLDKPCVATLPGASRVTLVASGEESITGNDFASRAGRWEHAIDLNLANVTQAQLPAREARRYTRLLEYVRMVLAAQYQHEGRDDLAKPLRQQAVEAIAATYPSKNGSHPSMLFRLVVEPMLKALYNHIAAGRRGAAHIAKRLL